jgi:hypothetical protein
MAGVGALVETAAGLMGHGRGYWGEGGDCNGTPGQRRREQGYNMGLVLVLGLGVEDRPPAGYDFNGFPFTEARSTPHLTEARSTEGHCGGKCKRPKPSPSTDTDTEKKRTWLFFFFL